MLQDRGVFAADSSRKNKKASSGCISPLEAFEKAAIRTI
jgi:hypothetical protein